MVTRATAKGLLFRLEEGLLPISKRNASKSNQKMGKERRGQFSKGDDAQMASKCLKRFEHTNSQIGTN